MPSLNVTTTDISIIQQNLQDRYIKIELLNYQFQTVDYIEGTCIDGNISIDANSDIRRTGSISLVVNDKSFEVASGGKIWLEIRSNIQ